MDIDCWVNVIRERELGAGSWELEDHLNDELEDVRNARSDNIDYLDGFTLCASKVGQLNTPKGGANSPVLHPKAVQTVGNVEAAAIPVLCHCI